MNPPIAAAVGSTVPPTSFALEEPIAWILAALALVLSGFFATLRLALQRALPSRVLERAPSQAQRRALEPLLERADSLATSASTLMISSDLVFTVLVLGLAAGDSALSWPTMGLALVITVPMLVLADEVLPSAVVRSIGDELLARTLPAFHWMQLPLGALVFGLEGTRRSVQRLFGLSQEDPSTSRIVEDLREVIEESAIDSDLDETEREIIENVMDARDVDVAEIMTPRTEIYAVEVEEGLPAVIAAMARNKKSRIPVYRGTLDEIVGTVSASDLIRRASDQPTGARGEPGNGSDGDPTGVEDGDLEALLRPAYFVPETKLVGQLLAEFRREKLKMAIILDEYGGTAGLVTLADVLGELVGDIPEEHATEEPLSVRRVSEGLFEVEASLRVSDVNEELELELPEEEDYETLGGFVLAELGRFPKRGESFRSDAVEFTVLEATDRRVLKVRVRKADLRTSA